MRELGEVVRRGGVERVRAEAGLALFLKITNIHTQQQGYPASK